MTDSRPDTRKALLDPNEAAAYLGVSRSYSQAVGPIIRWWFKYQTGSPTVANVPSIQEMEAILEQHPGITESAAFLCKLKTLRQRCFPGVQGFVHAYASERYDREMADSFMQDLNDGAALDKTNPIYVLRKRLIDPADNKRPAATYVLAWTIKAWNAWINGDKIQVIKWSPDSPSAPEEFPRFGVDRVQSRSQKRSATVRNRSAVARAS